MRTNILIISQTVVWIVFAAALLVLPGPFVSLFGDGSGPLTDVVARVLGAELIGLAVVSFASRRIAAAHPRSGLIVCYVFSNGLGAAVTLAGVLSGALNAFGWSLVAIYLFYTAGFVVIRFRDASRTDSAEYADRPCLHFQEASAVDARNLR